MGGNFVMRKDVVSEIVMCKFVSCNVRMGWGVQRV
jgi:hypothetical protein